MLHPKKKGMNGEISDPGENEKDIIALKTMNFIDIIEI